MNSAQPSHACRQLRLRGFRNFAELELQFPPEGAAIIGDNGAGKTNLVESLYYLEIFRSFRGAPDEQLVRFGEEAFHIRGRFAGPQGRQHEITAAFERAGRRKRVTLDGVEPDRLGDAIGHAGAVVFSPSDVSIIGGAPGERRRFLDIVLSLHRPGYLAALQRYRQILKQRNAVLRDGAVPGVMAAWNEALAQHGARITLERAAWVASHAAEFQRRSAAIGGGPGIALRYVPSVHGADTAEDEAAIHALFLEQLDRVAQRERERGVTLVGPHRDDLYFAAQSGAGEVDLREFGSGGQQRTGAVALRMIEAVTAREATGRQPIFLLDDVFAELDPGRAARILELLEAEEEGQVILTAPKESDLEVRRGALPHWRIRAGQVFA